MRVLVAYASKHGGTLGLAEWLTDALRESGLEVTLSPAEEVGDISGFDAIVLGGCLYVFRWHADARRFVKRHRDALSTKPVWLFSSGPLDETASETTIPPVRFVRKTITRLGARGHKTFGGRLLPRAGATLPVGDWRDRSQVEAWAAEIADELAEVAPMR
ncbi:MAG TPA: flavodoxin domain-containing protein [Acidimicrobiia bacterium]